MRYPACSVVAVVLLSSVLGCVFNAEVVTLTKSASYAGTDWLTFRVDMQDGPVTVFGQDSARIDVSLELEAVVLEGEEAAAFDEIAFDLEVRNEVLLVQLSYPDDLGETIQLRSIRAYSPREAWLDLATGNSDITVFGMEGNVVARTSNGDISVQTTGVVSLDTSNGRIDLETAGGGRADTSNGEIFATVSSADIGSLRLNTANGDVFVYLPDGAGFDLDLETSNGDIDLERVGFEISGDSFFGPIRGGGPLIRVRTSNGDIKIR